jgi:peptidoglycan hydrolase-like protein with peptidoglycan-binding domain
LGLQIYTGARGQKFICDADGGFGDQVAEISIRADAPIMSCAREAAAEPLLRQLGLHSQRQLYDCAQAKLKTGRCPPECGGNCNAANPPGRSTHERFNDGLAYSFWPPWFHLPVWARGIDVERSRVPEFCAEARKEGFTVTLTYPGSAQETQHVNFRKQPTISLWSVRPLQEGSTGLRVRLVVRLLWAITDPQTHKPYLDPHVQPEGHFTAAVTAAVKAFQHDQHQNPDGTVGVHTIRALRAARRLQQQGGQTRD